MAGRSVDVSLVIKARNEAEASLNAVAKALENVTKAQMGMSGGASAVAKATDTLIKDLGALGDISKNLDNALKSANSAFDAQTARLSAANGAIDERKQRLNELLRTEQEVARIQAQGATRNLRRNDIGPRIPNLTAITSEIQKQQQAVQKQEASLNGLVDNVLKAREAQIQVRAAQDQLRQASVAVSAEFDRQSEALVRLTAATDRQAAADQRAAETRRRGQELNRRVNQITGVTGTRATDAGATFSALAAREEATALRASEEARRRRTAAVEREKQVSRDLEGFVKELRREYDAEAYSAQFLERQTQRLTKARQLGIIATDKELEQAQKLVKARAGQLNASQPSLLGLTPYASQNLLFQFNDVATQLASGTSLTQTLAQQGGQILQLFPRVGNAIAAAFSSPPLLAAVAVFGGIAIAIGTVLSEAERLRELDRILSVSADGANFNAQALRAVASEWREVGIAAEDAAKVTRILLREGFDQSQFAEFGEQAKGLSLILEVDVPQAADLLADALNGSLSALERLDEQTNIFSTSQLENIRTLIEQGDQVRANAAIYDILSPKLKGAANDQSEFAKASNSLGAAWDRVKQSLADNAFLNGIVSGLAGMANGVAAVVEAVNSLDVSKWALLTGGATAVGAAAGRRLVGRNSSPYTGLTANNGGSAFTGIAPNTGLLFPAPGSVAAQSRPNRLQEEADALLERKRKQLELEGRITSQAQIQARLAEVARQANREINADDKLRAASAETREAFVQSKVAKERVELEKQLVDFQKQQAAESKRIADEQARIAKEQNTGVFQAKELLRNFESFRSTAYYDVNAYRTGYGSDTVTRADGTVQRVTANTTTTRADAERDLERRIGEFINTIKQQIGSDRFNQFNAQQQGALTSIAYNYGRLPERIVSAIRTGSTEQIAQAVRGLASDNNGINSGRRNREADIIATPNVAVDEGGRQTLVDEAERRAKIQTEFNADLDKEITKRQQATRFAAEQVGLSGEELLNVQKRQGIEEAIAAARAKLKDQLNDPDAELTDGQGIDIANAVAASFDNQRTSVIQSDLQQKVNELLALRDTIQAQIQSELERGNAGTAENLELQLGSINDRLRGAAEELLDYQIANAQALGLSAEALDTLRLKQDALNESTQRWVTILGIGGQQIAQTFTNLAVNALDRFAQSVANGENVFKSLLGAFRQFAADFLLQIARMIQQQIIFNLVSSLLRGLTGGITAGSTAGLNTAAQSAITANPGIFHDGGIAGGPAPFRSVPASWFANATRYHVGGIAGLKPGEIPSILMKGEEVLTRDDPRHVMNGGGGRGDVKIINTFDAADMLSQGANTKTGERAILNMVRQNPRAFRQAMNGG